MSIDFNIEEEQKEMMGAVNHGPIPAGSKVLVKLTLEKPRYQHDGDPLLTQTKNGLLQLPTKIEVVAGTYTGLYFFEAITVPASAQVEQLDKGQQVAAQIGGRILRAIVESARAIDPKDNGIQACKQRKINSWMDLDGIEFPLRMAINDRPYQDKNGKDRYRNRIGSIVPCTDKDYEAVCKGGEIITDGPTTPTGKKQPQGPAKGDAIPYEDTPPMNDGDVPF